MQLDEYFFKVYNKNTYNCAHFASEVWESITSEDIRPALTGVFGKYNERTINVKARHSFVKLKEPESPCIAVFSSRRVDPHVGIYINGKVLHIKETGVEYQPIEAISYNYDRTRFYK